MRGSGLYLTNELAEIMVDYMANAVHVQLNQSPESENIEVTTQASDKKMQTLGNAL